MNRPSATGKAFAAWGKEKTPLWIEVLAKACDESSLRKVAKKLNVSPAIISLALSRKREKLDFIREKIETELMVSTVNCPVLGVIGRLTCLQEQNSSFNPANPTRIHVYRSCRNGCIHYKENK